MTGVVVVAAGAAPAGEELRDRMAATSQLPVELVHGGEELRARLAALAEAGAIVPLIVVDESMPASARNEDTLAGAAGTGAIVLRGSPPTAASELASARKSIRRLQRTFLGDSGLSDDEVEEAMIDELDRTLDHPARVVYPSGTVLLDEDQPVDGILVVLSGRVRLYRHVEGHDVVFHSRTAGRIVGLSAMVLRQPAAFTCQAMTELTAIPVSFEQLDAALQKSPTLSVHLVDVLVRSLARRNLRSVEQRVHIDRLARELAVERDQLADALARLEQAQSRLVESEKMATLGQLVAGVAHELNNPVAAIERGMDFLTEDIERLTTGHPQAAVVLASLECARSLPPLGTAEERQLRREVAAHLGDEALARRLVGIGIRSGTGAAELLGTIAPATRAAVLEEMELYYRLGTSLRNVRSSARRISAHVKSLRSYARADHEQRSDVDVEEGIEESLMLLNHRLGEIEVSREYGSLPSITAFPGALNQVWTNLLSNAIQAMDGRGTLTVETDAPDPTHVRISIIDTGPGISPADLDRIFDLHFTTKGGRVEFGLGLGLTISRDIVERHHGTIEVDSRPGRTRFQVTLPVHDTPEEGP